MRIYDQPMVCAACGHNCILDDCDIDDPFGDGGIGCPLPDCGGEMIMKEPAFAVKEEK